MEQRDPSTPLAPPAASTTTPPEDQRPAASAEPAAEAPPAPEGGGHREDEGDPGEPALPERPRLRPLDAYPIHNPHAPNPQQRHLLALRDPAGVAPGVITLPPLGVAVLDLCDGTRTLEQISAEFLSRHRSVLSRESLVGLLKRLDEGLMLDSARFRAHAARVFGDFARASVRPPILAGSAYPAEAAALTAALDALYAPPRGPGLPAPHPDKAAPRGMLVPQVDLGSGGPAYAWAYHPLLQAAQLPDLVVLLGVDHSAEDIGFSLTRKHFATPLGTLPTDTDLVDRLLGAARAEPKSQLAEALLRDEHHHRGERSLEAQLVWLQHLMLRRSADATPKLAVLPILCGSMQAFIMAHDGKQDPQGGPLSARVFAPFLRLLQAELRRELDQGRRVLLLASADLAHVGPRFGDRDALTDEDCASLERRDRETLRKVVAGDAPGWFAELRRERDKRRVSGLTPIYVLLTLLRELHGAPVSGALRCYAQVPAEGGQLSSAGTPSSVVSLASVVFA